MLEQDNKLQSKMTPPGEEARKERYQLILPNYNGLRRLISVICETT